MKTPELFAYLHIRNAADAIRFYSEAFGAEEKLRLAEPSGRIGHAELEIGGTTLMLADEFPEHGILGPEAHGGTTVTLHLHVDNADEVIRRAVEAGAELEREPKDEFYGERSGVVRDPFGHRWNIGHSIEDVSSDEMQRRYTEVVQNQ